jgi:hypothetical protein
MALSEASRFYLRQCLEGIDHDIKRAEKIESEQKAALSQTRHEIERFKERRIQLRADLGLN